jgi:hypothetical protein
VMSNRVIQFLHPGPEHGPDRPGWKDWNRADHKRKFLLAEGSWTQDPRQSPTKGSFTFWGEWEPQSEVRRLTLNTRAGHPNWLHTPHLRLNEVAGLPKQDYQMPACAAGWPQNTDPLVFGDRFRYVLCRQFNNSSGLPTEMARLQEGDIILFGSHIAGAFVLDTVFVVGIYSAVRRNGPLPNWESELHRRITMDLFQIPGCGLRLYGGETWCSGRPFSFVPCLPVDGSPRGFMRPVIEPSGVLSDMISPNMKQNFKVTRVDSLRQVRLAWDAVVQQVLSQACTLGIAVDEPDASI